MVKDQKKQTTQGVKKGAKSQKQPEVEDFFTNFLSKKVRNINKKITHIQELEKKQKQTNEELKKDQQEMISRKAELLESIEENNNVKKLYLEAYSKKGEYEVAKKEEDNATSEQPKEQVQEETTATQVKEEPKVEVPKIDVAAIQAEAEQKGLERACSSLSKLFLLTNLFQSNWYSNQFEEVSGMDELSVLVDFKEELLKKETDNTAVLSNLNAKFVDFVNSAPTSGTSTKSMDFVADLVERVVSNQHFADLQLKAYVEPVVEKVEVVQQEEVVEKAPTASRKESQKQREQHDMFMVEDDDEEEHNEEADNNDAEEQEQIVESKVEAVKQPLQEQNGNKQAEKEKPKNLNDDEDEWVEVNKGTRNNHYDNRNKEGYRGRGNNRGGRGRGNNRNGERREWKDKDGNVIENRERREWKDKDGNVIEKRERREWKDKDGNVIERKDRREYDGERKNNYTRDGERENNYRNGGRGRGGRGGRGRGGKRDGQLERKKENDVPQNEGQNLKQVGTKDSVEVNNAPVQEVAQE